MENRNEKQNPFATLLREYETQTRNRTPETETAYTKALQSLATACTFSVLKKVYQASAQKTIAQLKRETAKALNDLDRIAHASENAEKLTYNDDGEIIAETLDKDMKHALNVLTRETLGDGLDLVSTAIIAILDQTAKAPDLSTNFMETPQTVRRLKRKVYIRQEDSKNGWETTVTTPIQEVYKAIRREIENNRAVQVANGKYMYLETLLTDTESDTTETAYRRLPKYSNLGGEVTDQNGKIVSIVADHATTAETDTLVAQMGLTAKQAQVLSLRQSGYGYKAIATYLGVTQRAVAKTVEGIQKKAVESGLKPIK